jgi:hypothetical protein
MVSMTQFESAGNLKRASSITRAPLMIARIQLHVIKSPFREPSGSGRRGIWRGLCNHRWIKPIKVKVGAETILITNSIWRISGNFWRNPGFLVSHAIMQPTAAVQTSKMIKTSKRQLPAGFFMVPSLDFIIAPIE